MQDYNVPVLIIGGGGCGLSASVFLSNLGVDSLLIERHPDTAINPKARYLNQRVMEIFRQHGVADSIYAESMPLENFGKISWRTSLAGEGPLDRRTFFTIDAMGSGNLTEYARDSPCPNTLYPQLRLEPLLRRHAEQRNPGGLLFNHEYVAMQQTDQHALVTVRNRTTGQILQVRARYVIGADGGKMVGASLGARMHGSTNMAAMVTLYFKADLARWIDDDEVMSWWFCNPDNGGSWASGVLGKLGPKHFDRHSEEWMFHFAFRPDDEQRFDESMLIPRLRELLKIPDLKVELLAVGRWTAEGVLIDRYRHGRVFLAGDAAHRHPPTTGLGLNSAIQDAHNLAWKLKAICMDGASPSLLDTYEQERRPVADRNVKWALLTLSNHQLTDAVIGFVRGNSAQTWANFEALFADSDDGASRRARMAQVMQVHAMEYQAHDLELGYYYVSDAIIPDGTSVPPRDPLGRSFMPTARPGHRFPHQWIERGGRRLSTLDLIRMDRFTLMIGTRGQAWAGAANEVSRKVGAPLEVVLVDADESVSRDATAWNELCGVGVAGAVLVRPDQHVAWRCVNGCGQEASLLRAALRTAASV